MSVERRDAGAELIAETERVSAPNYAPLPVVIARAEGVWAWDVDGRKYLDCISAYSSLNQDTATRESCARSSSKRAGSRSRRAPCTTTAWDRSSRSCASSRASRWRCR